MKSKTRQLVNGLLVSLLFSSQTIQANTLVYQADPVPAVRPFGVSMYIDAQKKINLFVSINRPGRVTITLKDPKHTVLFRESFKRAPDTFRQKFNFEEAKSGTYQLEVSDGKETIRQRIEVVDVAPIDSQRYITYGSQAH